jgi:hypothetical protein
MRARPVALVSMVVASTLATAGAARADEPDKARCASAYERAQELQRGEALGAARKQLLICRDTCPDRLRRDCVTWLADVEALTPTLLLRPRDDAGRPVRAARVTIDGELLAEAIDPAAAIAIDPGDHVLRFEHPDLVPAEVKVSIHGGERDREVALTLWRRAPKVAVAAPPPSPAPRPHRTSAYVLGLAGAGLLAIGGGIGLGGHIWRADLKSSCAPLCDQADADGVVTLWWTGGIVAAVGLVAAAIGGTLWLLPQREGAVSPAAGGSRAAR